MPSLFLLMSVLFAVGMLWTLSRKPVLQFRRITPAQPRRRRR